MHLNGECVIRLRLPLPRLLLLFVHLPLLLLVVAVVVVFFFIFSFVVVAFLVIRTFYACLRAIHVVVALFVVVLLLVVVVVVLVVWHLALASSSGCSSTYSKQLHTPCMAVCVFVLEPLCVFVCVRVHRAIRLATFVLVQARWPAVHTLKGLWRRCCCCFCVGCGCALDSSCTHDENKKSRFFFTYHHQ